MEQFLPSSPTGSGLLLIADEAHQAFQRIADQAYPLLAAVLIFIAFDYTRRNRTRLYGCRSLKGVWA